MYRRILYRKTVISSTFLLAVLICISSVCQASSTEVSGVPRVIDGDTLDISGQRIRLYGIDAFEKHQKCMMSGISWSCGENAVNTMVTAINGQDVSCLGKSHDRYNRLIAVCRVHGSDLGRIMVREGYALAYRAYSLDYVSDEQFARDNGNGAWSGQFVEPWNWRNAH